MSRARWITLGALVLVLALLPFVPRGGGTDDGTIRRAAGARAARAADRRLRPGHPGVPTRDRPRRRRRRDAARSPPARRPAPWSATSSGARSSRASATASAPAGPTARQAQVQRSMAAVAARQAARAGPSATGTGDLSMFAALRQAARMSPAAARRRPDAPSSPRPPARWPRSGCCATRSRACRCRRSFFARHPEVRAAPARRPPTRTVRRPSPRRRRQRPAAGQALARLPAQGHGPRPAGRRASSTAPTGAGRPRCR